MPTPPASSAPTTITKRSHSHRPHPRGCRPASRPHNTTIDENKGEDEIDSRNTRSTTGLYAPWLLSSAFGWKFGNGLTAQSVFSGWWLSPVVSVHRSGLVGLVDHGLDEMRTGCGTARTPRPTTRPATLGSDYLDASASTISPGLGPRHCRRARTARSDSNEQGFIALDISPLTSSAAGAPGSRV